MLVPLDDEESGTVALKLSATDYHGKIDRSSGHPVWPEVEVEVRFTRREYGGWLVRRADNGRILGWLYRSSDSDVWEARVSASAFRGVDIGDEGDVLDDVPRYLTNGDGNGGASAVGADRTREWAAQELLAWLVKWHAPAVGFGRKESVVRYADKHPERAAALGRQ